MGFSHLGHSEKPNNMFNIVQVGSFLKEQQTNRVVVGDDLGSLHYAAC